MSQRHKRRVTPFVGPMESWWDYLVENKIFTAEQIMEGNRSCLLPVVQLCSKNIYNWNCHDDVQLIVLVFNGCTMTHLQKKMQCSSFCIHIELHRLFGTDDLVTIRGLNKKERQKILCKAMEIEEKHEIDNISELVNNLLVNG